jgi:hypothetical protein
MKRILAFVLVIVVAIAIAGCGAKESKKDVFNLVENNYAEIAAACENKDSKALLAIDGVTQVNIVDGYVIVFCEAKGISVSSQDYGFYYSVENSPITIDCNQDIVCGVNDLTPEESGYQCVVQGNTFYTEHIKGNIYFYSNAY